MKNILLSFIIMSSLCSISYAEDSYGSWGPWTTSSCYNGVDFRVRYERKTTIANKHQWGLQIRNRYQKTLNISWKMTEKWEKNVKTNSRASIESGGFLDRDYFLLTPPGDNVSVWMAKVNFGRDTGDYYGCDKP